MNLSNNSSEAILSNGSTSNQGNSFATFAVGFDEKILQQNINELTSFSSANENPGISTSLLQSEQVIPSTQTTFTRSPILYSTTSSSTNFAMKMQAMDLATNTDNSQYSSMHIRKSTVLNQYLVQDDPKPRTLTSFTEFTIVGRGTYGEVYKAKDKETNETVAIKTMKDFNDGEGFSLPAVREIKVLRKLNNPKPHENIVHLKEVLVDPDFATKPQNSKNSKEDTKATYHFVFEYCENDLTGLIEKVQFRPYHVMCIMKQILEGLDYAHAKGIIHRDIKSANILLNNRGIVKIADWGLSKLFTPGQSHTNRVVTLWYRAPELLLGDTEYTQAVDMWAIGCIFAELLGKKSILPGEDEMKQLKLIYQLCGSPTSESWPKHSTLPLAGKISSQYTANFEQRFDRMHPTARDLLSKMLTLDPEKRITAADALDHDYFWGGYDGLTPCEPRQLPLPQGDGYHEMQVKRQKTDASQHPQQGQSHHRGPAMHRQINHPNPAPQQSLPIVSDTRFHRHPQSFKPNLPDQHRGYRAPVGGASAPPPPPPPTQDNKPNPPLGQHPKPAPPPPPPIASTPNQSQPSHHQQLSVGNAANQFAKPTQRPPPPPMSMPLAQQHQQHIYDSNSMKKRPNPPPSSSPPKPSGIVSTNKPHHPLAHPKEIPTQISFPYPHDVSKPQVNEQMHIQYQVTPPSQEESKQNDVEMNGN